MSDLKQEILAKVKDDLAAIEIALEQNLNPYLDLISASTPAASIALRAAAIPISEVVSPSAAMCRRLMPERSRIHSSDVSRIFSNSLLVITCSGR